jgi:histidine ammonia-lyase
MVHLSGHDLTLDEIVAVARYGESVAPLGESVKQVMGRSREWVRRAVERADKPIYGVNTGFGPLASEGVRAEQAGELSRNLVLNCCAGTGPALSPEIVRAMMMIRVNTLARGNSGVRPEVADTYIRMLNEGVVPFVPSLGSLGASGDLAPLAAIAAVMTRDHGDGDGGYSGQAWHGGELMSGAEAMAAAGIPRFAPLAKEGLALTNGTTFMVAAGVFGVELSESLLRHAEIAAALTFESLLALSTPLHPALNEANRQYGQAETAARLRALLAGSRLIDSVPDRVQDAYSLRCTPQVLGPISDAVAFVRSRFESLVNGTTDNPLIFVDLQDQPDGASISGGNFHGQGPAMWLDFLGIAASEIGGISERRTFRLLTPDLNAGLPSMLVYEPGLNSGLMVAQYTAAALVSENKTLAHPDSVDSIPSSANQEDHVSMGANAGRHALQILDNVRTVVAIELLTAAQAVDLRPDGPARLGVGTNVAHGAIRERVTFLERDRAVTPDIEAVVALIESGELVERVDRALATS